MFTPEQDFLAYTLAQVSQPFASENQCTTNTLKNGSSVKSIALGVLLFEPPKQNAWQTVPEIVLSAGIHGDETAAIELLNALTAKLMADEFTLACRVLVILANPWAIKAGCRQIRWNLNRLFAGAQLPTTGLEPRRARQLEQLVADFFTQAPKTPRYHFDLHCAIRPSKRAKFAIAPYRNGKPYYWSLFALLARAQVNTLVFNNAPTHTFSFYSYQYCQAESVTLELGQAKPFGHNDLNQLLALKTQLLCLLQQAPLDLRQVKRQDLKCYQVAQVVNKTSDDLQFHFAPEQANFTEFAQGTLLVTDGEHQHYVQAEQEAIVFANAQVEKGQRALLTLVPAQFE